MITSSLKNYSQKENIIGSDLEKYDPTPNIYELFRQFNRRFFWDKLNMVEVSWSGSRMTRCAGLCSFHPSTGYCKITLSAPLLSLRPRQDLVETLLHEMIHAFLFMTGNNKDRSDHGPEFCKHMKRINQEAGTNITVYHTFNAEVAHFQSHVWRCNGPCQTMGPFYGFVRRATNRAPGPNDNWWNAHKVKCSGVFEKIEEPPGYKNKKQKTEAKAPKNDLRNFFTPVNRPSSKSNISTLKNVNAGGKISAGAIYNKGTNTFTVTGPSSSKKPAKAELPSPPSKITPERVPVPIDLNHVRDVWAKKYPEKKKNSPDYISNRKLPESNRSSIFSEVTQCIGCDMLLSAGEMASHSQECSAKLPCPVCSIPVKRGCLEQHLNSCLSDSLIEETFVIGDKETDEAKAEISTGIGNQNVVCPVCGVDVLESSINVHIDECLTLKALPELLP